MLGGGVSAVVSSSHCNNLVCAPRMDWAQLIDAAVGLYFLVIWVLVAWTAHRIVRYARRGRRK